jgi:hypothetical protein
MYDRVMRERTLASRREAGRGLGLGTTKTLLALLILIALPCNHPIWRETDVDAARAALAKIHDEPPTALGTGMGDRLGVVLRSVLSSPFSVLSIASRSSLPASPSENREPRTENRELRTENREPRTANREPRTENREPRTEPRTTPNRSPITQSASLIPCIVSSRPHASFVSFLRGPP